MNKQTSHIAIRLGKSTILAAIALLIGALIYILLRLNEPQFYIFFNEIGIDNWLNIIRQNTLSSSAILPKWIIFSLPNGLWAFAYSLIITSIWSGSKSKNRYFWLVSIPVLVLGFEALQLTEIIRGTFCIEDIVFGLGGIIIGIIVGNKKTKIKKHEKNIT